MRPLKPISAKRSSKSDRQFAILSGLVEYYLNTGRPVGSNTLKEAGFPDLSSATIRNYFARLETEGYLIQNHTSGGRVPTEKAYRLYAEACREQPLPVVKIEGLKHVSEFESKEVALYLQHVAETTGTVAKGAVYLSAPRFDQDYVIDMKLVSIDHERCLAILTTSFGQVFTELLYVQEKYSSSCLKRMESYFRFRLTGQLETEHLEPKEREEAQRLYHEAMARYLVHYSHFTEDDVYRTGFSELLAYPEFKEASALVSSLSLFENTHALRGLIKETLKTGKLKCWIGQDLLPYLPKEVNCAVVAVPYCIGHRSVGSIGVIGPMRLKYRELFSVLQYLSEKISECLTSALYKHKITFRPSLHSPIELNFQNRLLLEDGSVKLEGEDGLSIDKHQD